MYPRMVLVKLVVLGAAQFRGREPSHDLLHHVRLHFSVEERLFGFFREHLIVERDVPPAASHDHRAAGGTFSVPSPTEIHRGTVFTTPFLPDMIVS